MTPGIGPPLLWGGFLALLAAGLAVDLVAHRRPRDLALGEAVRWTAGWVAAAMACAGAVWLLRGGQASLQFLAAYSVEWALSMDNVLVFAALIAGLAVPARQRYLVLFAGSLGAIVLRLAFLVAGSALLGRFAWLTYVFGALLLVLSGRMALQSTGGAGPPAGGLAGSLRARPRLRRLAPPLVAAALLVTVADVVFATDSIPAVLAMTRDPLVAFGSNAMAVLGLRSLYFVVQDLMGRLRYLRPALALLLVLAAGRMIAAPFVDVPIVLSLVATVGIPSAAAAASLLSPARGARYVGLSMSAADEAPGSLPNGGGTPP